MEYLGKQGVNNALIEAGPGLVTSILAADAVDRIYWTQSNHILGSNALAAVENLGNERQIRKQFFREEVLPNRSSSDWG